MKTEYKRYYKFKGDDLFFGSFKNEREVGRFLSIFGRTEGCHHSGVFGGTYLHRMDSAKIFEEYGKDLMFWIYRGTKYIFVNSGIWRGRDIIPFADFMKNINKYLR